MGISAVVNNLANTQDIYVDYTYLRNLSNPTAFNMQQIVFEILAFVGVLYTIMCMFVFKQKINKLVICFIISLFIVCTSLFNFLIKSEIEDYVNNGYDIVRIDRKSHYYEIQQINIEDYDEYIVERTLKIDKESKIVFLWKPGHKERTGQK